MSRLQKHHGLQIPPSIDLFQIRNRHRRQNLVNQNPFTIATFDFGRGGIPAPKEAKKNLFASVSPDPRAANWLLVLSCHDRACLVLVSAVGCDNCTSDRRRFSFCRCCHRLQYFVKEGEKQTNTGKMLSKHIKTLTYLKSFVVDEKSTPYTHGRS